MRIILALVAFAFFFTSMAEAGHRRHHHEYENGDLTRPPVFHLVPDYQDHHIKRRCRNCFGTQRYDNIDRRHYDNYRDVSSLSLGELFIEAMKDLDDRDDSNDYMDQDEEPDQVDRENFEEQEDARLDEEQGDALEEDSSRYGVPEPREVRHHFKKVKPGYVVVDSKNYRLYYILDNDTAIEYVVAVGKEGFEWSGEAYIDSKAVHPDWHPTARMRRNNPNLPDVIRGGDPKNPYGPVAMYLSNEFGKTQYRIHGTNEPWSIGKGASSGCIRMLNEDAKDLFYRVKEGTRVIVLSSGREPGIY